MDRFSWLMFAWLTVPGLFAVLPLAIKRRDFLFAGIFTYFGVLGLMFFFGNLIILAGRQ